ncbi:MAG: hypothetical protein R2828_18630 [Saprospiraceae bacterium]
MMNKLVISTIILLSCFTLGHTQTMQAWVDEGEKAFEEGDYYGAFKCYEIALKYKAARMEKYDSIRTSMLFHYAESARLAQIYAKADSIYQEVLKSPNAVYFPLTNYWLGKVKHTRGKYEQARDYFQSFLDQSNQVSEYFTEEAEKGFENALWAITVAEQKEDIPVYNLGKNINDKHSDYAAAFKGDTMYYSSYRFLDKKDSLNPPRYYMRIMESAYMQEGKELPAYINRPGRHVAHTAFNKKGNQVYFTICDYVKKDTIQCKLFRSDIAADGSWVNGIELNVNAKGFTNTHPNIGMDYGQEKEILYFASDRQGGEGGLDIWYSTIDPKTGNIAPPTNLREINTAQNDATPFFDSESQSLYFSTEGYQTLGGFDIYKTKKRGNSWTTPEHLGIPTNSSYNDLYYSLVNEDDGKTAYFSSNRPDTSAIFWDSSKDYCCNDIYKLKLPLIDLLARTFNLKDSTALSGATVALYEISLDGKEMLLDSMTNFSGNDFTFSIEKGKQYRLKATKAGFSSDLADINTEDPAYKGLSRIEKDLFLDPSMDLVVKSWHLLDTTLLTQVRVELYELTAGGPQLATSKVNLLSNDVTFPVERGRKYRIRGFRPGFIDDDTVDLDLANPVFSSQRTATADLFLGQMLEVNTFEAGTLQALSGVTVELYDLSNGDPRLIHSSTNTIGNDFKYPLHLDRPYLVKASRQGYDTVIDTLKFGPNDAILGNGRLIFDVYLPRPFELVLYFDNDHPNPRTRLRRTNLEYITTNNSYYEKKDHFIKSFTDNIVSKNDSFIISRRFQDFFDRDVHQAPTRLLAFSDRLIAELPNLGADEKITLQLMGSASPRGATAYNDDLVARRIDCVKNHFERYKNGILKPYIASGKLVFKETNFGEDAYNPESGDKIEKPTEEVSDKMDDLRASVYDLVASARRHVRVRLISKQFTEEATTSRETITPHTIRDEK